MFGYVRASKPELKIKEYDMYKAVYCSLCRYLGKEYGFVARMMLSYDFTFLALLIMSQQDGFCGIERKICCCNPLKKCNYCKDSADAMDIPASALVILTKHKIEDNIKDERGIKRLGYRLVKPIFAKPYKHAVKKHPYIEEIAKEFMQSQAQLEADGCKDMDVAAAPTGEFLAKLFCYSLDGAERVLCELGDKIGRWIYIMDAVCDFVEDKKRGRYNPLSDSEDCVSRARANMSYCIIRARSAFELLDIKKFKDILGNILYVGLDDTMEKELTKI